jgi:hypothetical protein
MVVTYYYKILVDSLASHKKTQQDYKNFIHLTLGLQNTFEASTNELKSLKEQITQCRVLNTWT